MGAMAQADVGHGVNAAFPEGKRIQGHEIRCVATTASGTCGALLRDKDGHQARDDVFFARHTCEHGLCGACLVGQVLKCTSAGQVYKCPECCHGSSIDAVSGCFVITKGRNRALGSETRMLPRFAKHSTACPWRQC